MGNTGVVMRYLLYCAIPYILSMTGADNVFHNQFAVQIKGGEDAADGIASRHGLLNRGSIGGLQGHYLFESPHIKKRSAEPCSETRAKLESDQDILWFEQQKELTRQKRGGEL